MTRILQRNTSSGLEIVLHPTTHGRNWDWYSGDNLFEGLPTCGADRPGDGGGVGLGRTLIVH